MRYFFRLTDGKEELDSHQGLDLIGPAALVEILRTLPPGITELGCHPGEADGLDSMYLAERAVEVRTLCDPRVRTALAEEGIELCSFADLSNPSAHEPAGSRLT